MNTPKQNADALCSPPVQRLLASMQAQASTGRQLKYGFQMQLSQQDQAAAVTLNSIYESVLWGADDGATNQRLCADEEGVLSFYLKNSIFGLEVLEVGCGSGRVTKAIAPYCRSLVALDREALNISRLKRKLSAREARTVFPVVADFSDKSIVKKQKRRFSSVLLMENLIGMNPRAAERARIFRHTADVLMPAGMALFAFRVVEPNARTPFTYQAMPYATKLPGFGKVQVPGIAINWTVRGFLEELEASGAKLDAYKIFEGSPRPAGGRMFFASLIKPM